MSIPISFKNAKDNIKQIKNHLILTKRTNDVNNFMSAFIGDKENNKVYIPFKYCSKFFEHLINYDEFDNKMGENVSPFTYNEMYPLRDKQVPVVDEAMKMLFEKHTVILNLHTGFGKTVCATYLSSLLGGVTFIIMKSEILIDQWDFSFKNFTIGSKIYIVGGKNTISIYEANIVICMNLRIEKVPVDFLLHHVTTLIIDEVDDLCTCTGINAILRVCPRYIISCTATLRRRDGMIDFLYLFSGKNNLIRVKYEGPLKIYKVLTGIKVKIKKQKNGKVNWTALNRSLFEHEERNKLICALIDLNKNYKVLNLTWYKDHVETIYDCLKRKNPNKSCTKFYGTQKSYNDSDVLISTISKTARGFDEKTFCKDFGGVNLNVLVLVGTTKSLVLMEQIIGRILRSDNPIVYYLIDDNPISKSHWKECVPLFKELNGDIETLNMKQNKNTLKVNQKQLELNSKIKIAKINIFLNQKS